MKKIAGFFIAADAIVPCPVCGRREGKPCKGLARGRVHFGRRLKRLLLTAKAGPIEREKFEKEAVEMLQSEMRK